MIACFPTYFSRWCWAGKLSCSVPGSEEGLWFGVGWGEQLCGSLLVVTAGSWQQNWLCWGPDGGGWCAVRAPYLPAEPWLVASPTVVVSWPPLSAQVWVLPGSKCSLAPTLPLVVLRAFLRVSDLRHSWLPDVRAAQLAWSPCQASLLWPFIFTFHVFFPNHPRGTESFSLLIKQIVSSTHFSCDPWRSLSLFSSGLG